MQNKKVKCTKDVEFAGQIYAHKGDMIEVTSVGSQLGFNGSNGLFFSMSISYAIQYFEKQAIENLFK